MRTWGWRRQATICRPGRGSIPEKSTGPLYSKPGAYAARLRSAAPVGAGNAARRNARWRDPIRTWGLRRQATVCRPVRGSIPEQPTGPLCSKPGADAARLRSVAAFAAQSQKNQRDRSAQNLGLAPPGYDLSPRSGLGTRQEGMPGGAIRSGPGAGTARLRSAAPVGAQSQKNQRDRSAQNLGLTPPGYVLSPRSRLNPRTTNCGASRGQAWFLVFARRGMKNHVRCSRLGNGATRWGYGASRGHGASRGQAWFLVFARRGMKNHVRCSRLALRGVKPGFWFLLGVE